MKIDLSTENLRPIPIAAAAILLVHLFASLSRPADAGITYFAALACDAVALYACLGRAKITEDMLQKQWCLVATFLLCHAVGSVLLHLPVPFIGVGKFGVGIHEVVALVCALPLVAVLGLPEIGKHPTQDSDLSLWLASSQAVLFAGVAYYGVFYIHLFGPIDTIPGTAFAIGKSYMPEYAIFATAFTLRLIARSARQWTVIYASLAFYLWGIFAVNYCAPRFNAQPGSIYYLVSDAVILLFAVNLSRASAPTTVARASAVYLNLIGPVVFPLSIFYLAIFVTRNQLTAGLWIIGASLVLFAIRTTGLQAGYRRMQEQLVEDNQMTMLEARMDQLTGIPNRRSFDRTLDREWRRAERTRQPIGLLMVDVDKFKHLNDTQGHPAGDRCLKRIASVLDAKLTRATDFVARYGGEEFSVILTDTSIQDIKAIAESLRLAVAEARLPNATEIGQYVSISIGAALTYPAPPLTPSSLLSGADQALYQAKRGGRNRVHFTNMLDAPSSRAQTDGALQSLITDYKESVYGTDPDPLANREKVRSKMDRRTGQNDPVEAGIDAVGSGGLKTQS